jgi:hypothetical protein
MMAALLLAFVAFDAQAQTTDSRGRPITIATTNLDIFADADGNYTVRFLSPPDDDLDKLCLYRMDTGEQLVEQCITVHEGTLRVSWISNLGLGDFESPITLRATAFDLAGNESIKSEFAAILQPKGVPVPPPPPPTDPAPGIPRLLEP